MKKNFNTLLLFALLLIAAGAHAQTYLISTVAGNGGSTPFGPDGVAATASKLNSPQGVATDDSGNFYIADKINNRIRKVSKTGIITTIAGNGTAGYMGDGFAATAANLSGPTGVAKDRYGNIYIADLNNAVVRKVTPTGIISTFAGPGVATTLGDGGAATAAYLNQPVSVAVDKVGDVFIADQGNARIRRVDVTSGIITTYAGTAVSGYNMDGIAATTAQLSIPVAVCVDTFGNVYIADQVNYRIRKVTATSGMISTVVGTGTGGYSGNGGDALSAKISYTYGIAVDNAGNIFVSDNDEVRKVDASTNVISIYAGRYDSSSFGGDGALADTSKLNNPQGLAVDTAGSLYIADESNQRIRKVYKKPHTAGTAQVALQNLNVSVIPNPNSGSFSITGSLDAINDEHVSLVVMNMLGQVVYQGTSTTVNRKINAQANLGSGLPAGIYLLNVRSETQSEVVRFAIQR